MGLGWLGLHPSELADYTLRDLFRKLEGFNQVRQHDYRNRFEAARLTSWMVISALNGKSITPQGLLKFEWETDKTPKKTRAEISRNKRDELVKRWKIR